MSTRSDQPDQRNIPRSHTVKPMEPPPATGHSTSAQLKGDIDSGRTGDKNEVFDPALSPLGTDDEAAGFAPQPEQVDLARRQEGAERWKDGASRDSYAHEHSRKALFGYVGFIALLLVLFLGVFWMF